MAMAKRMKAALIATLAALLMAATAQAQGVWGAERGLAWSASNFPKTESTRVLNTPGNRAARGKWGRAQLVYYCTTELTESAFQRERDARGLPPITVAGRVGLRFAGPHGHAPSQRTRMRVDGEGIGALRTARVGDGDYVFYGLPSVVEALDAGIRRGSEISMFVSARERYGYEAGQMGLDIGMGRNPFMRFSWSLRGSSAAIGRACG